MLVHNKLTVLLLPNFSNADVVTAILESVVGEFWLTSAYMPYDDELEQPYIAEENLGRKAVKKNQRNYSS